MRSPDGFIEGDGLVPGYLELVTSWIHGLDDRPRPRPTPRRARTCPPSR
ncbi:hypothetical protein [Spongiactinospora gelatinilytica]|nr:hypothetical protein [Spongiactinospora gelatinilytica]